MAAAEPLNLSTHQQRCIALYYHLTDDFIHAVDSGAPLARRHVLADRSDTVRRLAWRAGIENIDFYYHLAKAIEQRREYFASGSKTYCTAEYEGVFLQPKTGDLSPFEYTQMSYLHSGAGCGTIPIR
jgi:hypothetical protein